MPLIVYQHRFISLLLEDMMGDDYHIAEDSISSPQIGSNIFMNPKGDTNGGRLTAAMMEVVRSKTPPSSSKALSPSTYSPEQAVSEVNVSPPTDAG